MDNPEPIPLTESARRTYLRAALFLAPAFLAWLFAYILILPTLEKVWDKAGMTGSKPQWLMDSSDFFMDRGRLILAAIFLFFCALEYFVPAWPRYRRFVVAFLTFALNALVLAGLATLCALATLAGKVLLHTP